MCDYKKGWGLRQIRRHLTSLEKQPPFGSGQYLILGRREGDEPIERVSERVPQWAPESRSRGDPLQNL